MMESLTVTPTADRILDLTLEIIHLLTGEDYSLVKTAFLFSNIYPPIATKWQRVAFRTPHRSMEQKILEVTKNIAELLTGEVPIRCQDVAVYLSMEERQYLEEHEELYEAAMMEDQIPVTLLDTPQVEGSDALSGEEESGGKQPEASGLLGDTSVDVMEEPRSHQVTTLCPARAPAPSVLPRFGDIRPDPGSRQADRHLNISTCEPQSDEAAGIPATRVPSSPGLPLQMVSEEGPTSPNVSRVWGDVKASSADIEEEPLPGRGGHLPAIRAPVTAGSTRDPEEGRPASVMAELLPHEGDISPPATVPTLRRDLRHRPDSTPGEERRPSCHTRIEGKVGEVSALPAPSDGASHAHFSHEVKKISFGHNGRSGHRDTYRSLASMQTVASEIEEEPRSLEEGGPLGRGQEGQYPPCHIKEEPRSWQEGDLAGREHQYLPCHTMASPIKEESRSWEECGLAGREQRPQTPLHPNTSSQVKEELYLCKEEGQEGKSHQPLHSSAPCLSCTICGKSFLQGRELELHCKRHVADKRYSCPQCGKTFRQKSDSDNHMRVHTGERPFPCAICGKRFTTRSDRAKHHRIHTGERRFMCSLCGKGFIQKVALDKHMRVHTGEKPFSCQHCGKRFSEKSNVARHLRVHSATT